MLFLWLILDLILSIHALTFLSMSASYAEFKKWEASKKTKIQFRFKTHKSLGLLLYIDDSEEGGKASSFLQIELRHGILKLSVQMGSEDYKSKKKVQVGANMNDLKWHLVQLDIEGSVIKLSSGSYSESMQLTGEQSELTVNTNLFIGGIPRSRRDKVVNQRLLSIPRFVGCFDSLKYISDDDPPDEAPLITAKEVEEGCIDKCKEHSCANQGVCQNWFNTIHCDCAGTGYEGQNCSIPSISVYLGAYDYITWNVIGVPSTRINRLIIRFKTYLTSGLLFSVTKAKDFLTMEIIDGIVHCAINLGGGTLSLSVGKVDPHLKGWHTIKMERNNRFVSLTFDDRFVQNGSTSGPHSIFNIDGAVAYIGGHLNPWLAMESKSRAQFSGCLQHVYFNGIDILYKALYTQSLYIRLHGDVQEGCPFVFPSTTYSPKTIADNGSTYKNLTTKFNTTVDPRETGVRDPFSINEDGKADHQSVSRRLSNSAVAGITVGIVVGGFFFLVFALCLAYHVRTKYSTQSKTSTVSLEMSYKSTANGTNGVVPSRRHCKKERRNMENGKQEITYNL